MSSHAGLNWRRCDSQPEHQCKQPWHLHTSTGCRARPRSPTCGRIHCRRHFVDILLVPAGRPSRCRARHEHRVQLASATRLHMGMASRTSGGQGRHTGSTERAAWRGGEEALSGWLADEFQAEGTSAQKAACNPGRALSQIKQQTRPALRRPDRGSAYALRPSRRAFTKSVTWSSSSTRSERGLAGAVVSIWPISAMKASSGSTCGGGAA